MKDNRANINLIFNGVTLALCVLALVVYLSDAGHKQEHSFSYSKSQNR